MSATQGMPLFMEIGRVITPAPITDLDGTAIDISGAVEKSVQVTRVTSGESTEWSADFDTDGTDGQLVHVTESGELDEVGRWRVWAFVRFADGRELYSPERTFQVHETSEGGTGVGSGTTTHATRHHQDGADELLVEDLGSTGADGEVPIADGAGGLDMGPVPAHAPRHSAGAADPITAENLATAAGEGAGIFGDGSGGFRIIDFDTLAGLVNNVGPRVLRDPSGVSGDYTISDSDHWSLLRFTDGVDQTLTLPTGVSRIFVVVHNGGAGSLTISGAAADPETVLGDGDYALLVGQASGSIRVIPLTPRLQTGTTITADYTITAADHHKILSVDSATAVTITVPDTLPAETEVYCDVVGAGDVTFAPSGTQSLVGPGTTAVQGATAGVLVRSATRAKLVGELS